ncbi:MAG: glycoside hydrolase family 5 protein, partial [Turicibacter sp.]
MNVDKKVRGVNLGGWLVLERWMTPSLFEGYKAEDETNFMIELGDKAESLMKNHYDTWITEEDFKWIKEIGLNTVRIPVGHWIFGDCPPYVGAIEYLDCAMDFGKKYDLGVLIDFHAAPGSQNGFDNGGILGVLSWHKSKDNIDKSVEFIERLAKRYGQHEALFGIQLLNEPHWEIPMDLLQDFHLRAYEVARKYMNPNASIVMH